MSSWSFQRISVSGTAENRFRGAADINNQNPVMGLTCGVIARILRAMEPLRKSTCNICRIIIS